MNKNLIAEGLDIRNFLHFYIGQKVIGVTSEANVGGYEEATLETVGVDCASFSDRLADYYYDEPEYQLQLLLRPLTNMSNDEAREFLIKEGWGENLENIVVLDGAIECTVNKNTDAISRFTRCRPQMFAWLTSKGFDIFDLIKRGLAIDSTKRGGGN